MSYESKNWNHCNKFIMEIIMEREYMYKICIHAFFFFF